MWMFWDCWSGFTTGKKSMLSASVCLFHSLIMGMWIEMKGQHSSSTEQNMGLGV